MAKLASFRINGKAKEEGDWISPGDEYGDLLIRTRGFTDGYIDARAAKLRKAAQRYNGDLTRVPNAIANEITTTCLIDHCLLDVQNLEGPDGKLIDFARFTELLYEPDYEDLFIACLRAAAIAGRTEVVELDEAKKNSAKPS